MCAGDTVRIAVLEPPEITVTLGEMFSLTWGAVPEAERLIVPEKPLRLVSVIVEFPDPLVGILSEEGFAEMVKSGGGPDDVTVTETIVL